MEENVEIFKIRIVDCEKIKNHKKLKMFAGKVVIARKIPFSGGKCFEFAYNTQKGSLRHTVSADFVEVLNSLSL
jgi:hypothetical protein